MSAPASPTPVFDPAVPMTAKFRSDVARRLAMGWTWKELSETLKCNLDELCSACENDPEFQDMLEKAWARATFEGEADAMRRLRLIANTGSDASAKDACEVLARYAAERRELEARRTADQTRLEIEKLRAQTRLEVEKLRNERALAREQARQSREAREEEALPAPRYAPEPAQGEREGGHADEASRWGEEVYIWGGGHGVGCGFRPDAADLRVRVLKDRSRAGGSVYWVVAPKEGDEIQTILPKNTPAPTPANGLSA